MYVRRLALRDFRSWAELDLELTPGPTVLVGANGLGKTNLVEALWYCATLGSHRVAGDGPLIRAGRERALVSAVVVNEGRELAIDVEIVAGRANKLRLNRAPVRGPRDIIGVLRAVLFAPEDLALIRGDPAERRRYLDELASIRRPRVVAVRSDYDRVLRQRAALLKTAGPALDRGDRSVLSTLDVWDAQLAAHGAQLMAARLDLVNRLAPEVSKAYELLAQASRRASIVYRPNLLTELDVDPCEVATAAYDTEHLEMLLLRAIAQRRRNELARGVCLVGPHRDELELRLGAQPVKGYASHGESWSMALALRLGAYRLLDSEGAEPVLLLDDVFAELDSVRRNALADVAASAEQVLVTAAVPDDTPVGWRAHRIHVGVHDTDEGRISEVLR